MTSSLVDSNVIIDLIKRTPNWFDWSSRALRAAGNDGPIFVNQVIYAELAINFTGFEVLDGFLVEFGIEMQNLPWAASFRAGLVHSSYRTAGGYRDRTLPDFMIGAHAVEKELRLVTRYPKRFRRYFPNLNLLAPDATP
jgi:predicted nucleic acid-binding protein